jgi:hypothetical protein
MAKRSGALCRYGNCMNDTSESRKRVSVSVTFKGIGSGRSNEERAAFCCMRHAAKWLTREADRIATYNSEERDVEPEAV